MKNETEPSFDLTTKSGLSKAIGWFDEHGIKYAPSLWVQYQVAKKVYEWFWRNSGVPSEQQVEALTALIRAGKEQGAEKMIVEVSKEVGLGVGAAVEGCPVRAFAGTSQTIRLEVEYVPHLQSGTDA